MPQVVPKSYPSSFMTLKACPPTLIKKKNTDHLQWASEVSVMSQEGGVHCVPTLLTELWRRYLLTH